MAKKRQHPMQKVVLDPLGTARFRENAIVRYLLDAGPFDLNHLACLPNISREDREQFAQLVGYSVSGFGELNYVSDNAYEAAQRCADKLMEKRRHGKAKR